MFRLLRNKQLYVQFIACFRSFNIPSILMGGHQELHFSSFYAGAPEPLLTTVIDISVPSIALDFYNGPAQLPAISFSIHVSSSILRSKILVLNFLISECRYIGSLFLPFYPPPHFSLIYLQC